MPPLGPIKRKDLIRYLKQAGFEGPYTGGKHQFVRKGGITVRNPQPAFDRYRRGTPGQNSTPGRN